MNDHTAAADPAAFEIMKNALYKIAEEMRVVLAKTAYSPILKSAGDYSCGVFDAAGDMVRTGPRSADPSRLNARCRACHRAGVRQ